MTNDIEFLKRKITVGFDEIGIRYKNIFETRVVIDKFFYCLLGDIFFLDEFEVDFLNLSRMIKNPEFLESKRSLEAFEFYNFSRAINSDYEEAVFFEYPEIMLAVKESYLRIRINVDAGKTLDRSELANDCLKIMDALSKDKKYCEKFFNISSQVRQP